MTTATLFQKREALRSYYYQGIKPADGRQPIPEELSQQMVRDLKDYGVPSDALIGVHDTFLTLTLTLQEHGFSNIVVLEREHRNLTSAQEKYYNTIEQGCKKIGVTYYIPPMNNYNRCNMNFYVTIGNPPFSDTSSGSSNTKGLDDVFFLSSMERSDYVSMIIRSKHFVNQSSTFRKKLFKTGNIRRIKFLPEDTFPTVNVRTCIVTYDRNYKGLTEVSTLDGNTKKVDLKEDTIIHPLNGILVPPTNNLASRWKRGKLHLNKVVESNEGVTFVKALGRKDAEIETCIIDPNLESFGYKKHGVMIPNMGTADGKIGKVVVKPFEAVAGHSIVQFWTNTGAEAIQLAEYLQSDDVSQLIKTIKFSNPNPKALFQLIKDPLTNS